MDLIPPVSLAGDGWPKAEKVTSPFPLEIVLRERWRADTKEKTGTLSEKI